VTLLKASLFFADLFTVFSTVNFICLCQLAEEYNSIIQSIKGEKEKTAWFYHCSAFIGLK